MNPGRKMLVSRGPKSTGCYVSVRTHQSSGSSVLGVLMDSPPCAHRMKIIKSCGGADPRCTQTIDRWVCLPEPEGLSSQGRFTVDCFPV